MLKNKGDQFPPVAAFDAEHPQVLNALAQLGKRGVPVHLYSHHRFPAGFFSRHAVRTSWAPDPSALDDFASWLKQKLQAGEIHRVLPTTDLIAFHCAELRELFPAEVIGTIPTAAEIERTLFKPFYHRSCAEAGVAVPLTKEPRSKEEALVMAAQIGYPVLIKPKSHLGVGAAYRGSIVRCAEELEAAIETLPIPTDWQRRLSRWPDLHWPMLQRYVPGANRRVYNASGYMDAERGMIALGGVSKTAHYPPGIGVGAACECCDDPRLLDATRKIAGSVLKSGLFDIEFIEDGDQMLAIDFNPRLGGLVSLDIARGNDLPWLWYQATLGTRLPVQAPPRAVLHWRHDVPFHVGSLIRLLRGPQRLRQLASYWRALRRPTVSVVEQADWLPRWIHQLKMFAHPRHMLRVFWNDRTPRETPVQPQEAGKWVA